LRRYKGGFLNTDIPEKFGRYVYITKTFYNTIKMDDDTYVSIACKNMGWLRLVGSIKLQVSFAKEPYKRDAILQKRPII